MLENLIDRKRQKTMMMIKQILKKTCGIINTAGLSAIYLLVLRSSLDVFFNE